MEHSSAPSSTHLYDQAREALYGPPPSAKKTGFFGSDLDSTSLAARQASNNPFLDSGGEGVVTVGLVEPLVAEALSLEQATEKFKAAWQIPDTMYDDQLQRFGDITTQVLDSLMDKLHADLVQSVAGKLRWLYFGKANEPLPANLAVVADHRLESGMVNGSYQQSTVSVADVTTPLSGRDECFILSAFQNFGLAGITTERNLFRGQDSRPYEIAAAHYVLVKNSPYVQFLQSFKTKPTEKSDRPLSLHEKQLQASQAEHDVRQKFGLAPHDDVRLHTDAHRALYRKVNALDEATMPAKKESLSELDALREYILQDVQKWERSLPETDSELDFRSMTVHDQIRQGLFFPESAKYAKALAASLTETTDKPLIVNGLNVIREMMDTLFSSKVQTVDELIERLLNPHVHHMFNAPRLYEETALTVDQVLAIRGVTTFPPTVTFNDATVAASLSPNEMLDFMHMRSSRGDAAIVPKAEQDRREQYVVGTVERFIDDPIDRVIITTYDDSFSALAVEQAVDMRLHLQYFDSKQLPAVPGYDLIAFDTVAQTYDFAKAAVDPYDRADIELSASVRQSMLAKAKALQLPASLIKQLSRQAQTIADVAEIVAAESEYTYEIDPAYEASWMYQKNGKLQLQCSGATELLRLLLSHITEDRSQQFTVGSVSGLFLAADNNTITLNAHRQNQILKRGGKEYIVDATPAESGHHGHRLLGRSRPYERKRLSSIFRRKAGSTLVKETVELQTEQPPKKVEPAPVIVTRPNPNQPAQLKEQLITILQPLLKTVDQTEVFERLVSLGIDDPLRRIAELVLRSANGDAIAKTEITATQSYLETLKSADTQMFKKLKIGSYTPETLQSLQTFIQRLPMLDEV